MKKYNKKLAVIDAEYIGSQQNNNGGGGGEIALLFVDGPSRENNIRYNGGGDIGFDWSKITFVKIMEGWPETTLDDSYELDNQEARKILENSDIIAFLYGVRTASDFSTGMILCGNKKFRLVDISDLNKVESLTQSADYGYVLIRMHS